MVALLTRDAAEVAFSTAAEFTTAPAENDDGATFAIAATFPVVALDADGAPVAAVAADPLMPTLRPSALVVNPAGSKPVSSTSSSVFNELHRAAAASRAENDCVSVETEIAGAENDCMLVEVEVARAENEESCVLDEASDEDAHARSAAATAAATLLAAAAASAPLRTNRHRGGRTRRTVTAARGT